MKNKVLLICLSLLISLGVSAQKYTIYIDDFNSEIKIPNKVLSTIRNVVLDGIQQTNRVNIIDAVSVGANLNLSPLEDARRFRAEYLLKGNLIQREATDDGSSHRRYHSRENSYKEKFKLQLDLIRTSDGTTIGTRIYEETGSSSGKDASQFAALEHSLLGMSYEMRNFIENYFKVYGSILKLAGDNGKKAKTVYINLGYDDPIKEGQRFDVMEDGMIDGNYMEDKVGEVRIDKIMGPKISLCKVNKGGEDILRIINEGKITLRLVSRKAKLFDD